MNWGPGAQAGFQNALAMGVQFGQMARQRQEEREYKNALAQFDPSKPETLNPIMQVRPEVGIQLQGQVQAQTQAQREAGFEGLEKFRPILEQAAQGPEQYANAYRAAVDAGYDMSRVPTSYDPDWIQGQMMLLEAAKDPEKLDRIGKAMQAFGYTDPSQPGFDEALQEFTRMTFARESTDEFGRTVLVFPEVAPAGQPQPASQPAPNVAGEVMTLDQLQSIAQAQSPAAFQRQIERLVQGGVVFNIPTPEQAKQLLPSGTPVLLPDGSIGRVP